jgi:hypothetical protein
MVNKMGIVEALLIVIDLAKQNSLEDDVDECLMDEKFRQQQAIEIVEKSLNL